MAALDSIVEAADAVRASVACMDAHGFGQWALRLLASAEVIGFCGFRWLDDGVDRAPRPAIDAVRSRPRPDVPARRAKAK